MLDYTKISFNELDSDKPLQAFYNYDLKGNEVDSFLEEYATAEEVPEGVSVQKVELCLTIYAQHDFKLEACCTDANNEQYWVELNKQFTDADEFIQKIPSYRKSEELREIQERKKNKLATEIVELFEDLLDRKGIEIPCDDENEQKGRHDGKNTAKLYGMEYYNLVSGIQNLL